MANRSVIVYVYCLGSILSRTIEDIKDFNRNTREKVKKAYKKVFVANF